MDQRDMSDPLESSQKMVPDLIKLDQIPDNFLQHVETDLLETSTFQEATTTATGYASFNLAQKGFLHSHSKILVGLVPSAAGQMLPANIGIASIIDRAVLKVRKSGQVINDISDFGHFHAIKSCQISNETNREREQYMTGRIMNKEFKHYSDGGATANVTVYDANRSLGYGLDNGREYGPKGGAGVRDVGQNGLVQPFSLMTTASLLESPTYSIDISDLFLFMKTQSLPLYMIDQGLTLELYWSQTLTDRVLRAGGARAGILIDRNELKFVADYITYVEDDAMNRYRDANPVIDMSFSDYRLSKNTRTQAQIQAGFVRQLGMNNRVVPRVITVISNESDPGGVAAIDQSMLGKYNMMSPVENTGQTTVPGTLSYNIRYKSRFEFSQAITNKAQAFTQLVQSEGLPFVSRQEYSGDQGGYLVGRVPATGGGLFAGALVAGGEATFQGYAQDDTLGGQFFMLGTRLTNGRVGNDGVELHLTAIMPQGAAGVNTAYIVRTYLEYVRRARLENGEMEIMNA